MQDVVSSQVGSRVQRETLVAELLNRKHDQRHLQEHGVILEKVKTAAGHASTAVEINQVVLLGQAHMVEHFEIKLARLAPSAYDNVVTIESADRHGRMRHVRNLRNQLVESAFDIAQLGIDLGNQFLQLLAPSDMHLPIVVVLRVSRELRRILLLFSEAIAIVNQAATPLTQFDDPGQIDRNASVLAVLGDQIVVFANELEIKHFVVVVLIRGCCLGSFEK